MTKLTEVQAVIHFFLQPGLTDFVGQAMSAGSDVLEFGVLTA